MIHGLTDASGAPVTNVEEFRTFHKAFCSAFPNIRVAVEDVVAEGDRVVARCRVEGRQTGELPGLAASGSDVDFSGVAIVRVNDGKIAEAWNNFDFLTMNKQLGVI